VADAEVAVMLKEYEVPADRPETVADPETLEVPPPEAITPAGPETLHELIGGVVVDAP
jgi:hypothetical protein